MNQTLYFCDPQKNTSCIKNMCALRGGTCCITIKPEFALLDVAGNPQIVTPKQQLELRAWQSLIKLEKLRRGSGIPYTQCHHLRAEHCLLDYRRALRQANTSLLNTSISELHHSDATSEIGVPEYQHHLQRTGNPQWLIRIFSWIGTHDKAHK